MLLLDQAEFMGRLIANGLVTSHAGETGTL